MCYDQSQDNQIIITLCILSIEKLKKSGSQAILVGK